MVRVEDSGVSQTPSPSQSQRAWSVALGSGSVDEDASNATELFTLGYGGAKANWAVGGGAAAGTGSEGVWPRDLSVLGPVRVYARGAELARLPGDVSLPLIFKGAHEVVPPAGADTERSPTFPRKPPVA